MKNTKKTAAVLSAVLFLTSAFPIPASAAEGNTPKEEVVYINLCEDGSVKEINVVNIFEPGDNGSITDYGTYESVRNMTTTDAICYEGNTITISTDADKLYYEGRLKETDMPWNISIHYYMDGREYTADEIAGMSGKLTIKMSVRKNEKCDSSFFEGYALQAVFVLDTDHAANIVAKDGQIIIVFIVREEIF
ncbi:MAG: hypothetical protein ACI4SA_02660 [Lachnospiraceae bacterium]